MKIEFAHILELLRPVDADCRMYVYDGKSFIPYGWGKKVRVTS